MSTTFATNRCPTEVQLCFSWMDNGGSAVDSAQRPVRRPAGSPPSGSPRLRSTAPSRDADASSAVGRSANQQVSTPTATAPATMASRAGSQFHRQTRVGEVRLGAVMLRLLKRYGITDEEISVGIAQWNQRQQTSEA